MGINAFVSKMSLVPTSLSKEEFVVAQVYFSRVVIYEALFFDEAQDRMNRAPTETRTHSCSNLRSSFL